jgi:hypothetical protein
MIVGMVRIGRGGRRAVKCVGKEGKFPAMERENIGKPQQIK